MVQKFRGSSGEVKVIAPLMRIMIAEDTTEDMMLGALVVIIEIMKTEPNQALPFSVRRRNMSQSRSTFTQRAQITPGKERSLCPYRKTKRGFEAGSLASDGRCTRVGRVG